MVKIIQEDENGTKIASFSSSELGKYGTWSPEMLLGPWKGEFDKVYKLSMEDLIDKYKKVARFTQEHTVIRTLGGSRAIRKRIRLSENCENLDRQRLCTNLANAILAIGERIVTVKKRKTDDDGFLSGAGNIL